ncbi:MAG: hypothetical protein QUS14_03015 [Pyrinomonadaceae bacterium]|nr:hypothetical protein [Pyrinomonadaceae bacterium]
MNKPNIHTRFAVLLIAVAAAAGAAYGQTGATKTTAVKVTNTDAEAVPVKIIPMADGRKAFQARVIVQPTANGFSSALLQIPAGKRLIIENVSVITRSPEGMYMETNYNTYIDNNNDGVGDIADITFHRVVLADQGAIDGVQMATANHKVLVFADEQIGTGHFGVQVQARLNGALPTGGFAQAQYTFSGWVEDIPAVQ